MKIFFALIIMTLTNCATTIGQNDESLVKTVAFDTSCPESKVKIVQKQDQDGFGQYKVNACGKMLSYKRTGSVYHAADKNPMTTH